MDDINARLAEILNDPESMNRVREMAENLLSGEESAESNIPAAADAGIDAASLAKITGIMTKLKSAGDDNRTALLNALKPHLSEERRKKVDTAVKLLRLIELLPYLKDSGLLDF